MGQEDKAHLEVERKYEIARTIIKSFNPWRTMNKEMFEARFIDIFTPEVRAVIAESMGWQMAACPRCNREFVGGHYFPYCSKKCEDWSDKGRPF